VQCMMNTKMRTKLAPGAAGQFHGINNNSFI
jgi:hypothetical protein